jgi:beta-glucosidase/6-phospho-beta-glucosidase/beta-galactosidase
MRNQDDTLIISTGTDQTKNEYSLKHFPHVLSELKKRKLDLLINIPPFKDELLILSKDWIDYNLVYETRNKMGSLFPGLLGV